MIPSGLRDLLHDSLCVHSSQPPLMAPDGCTVTSGSVDKGQAQEGDYSLVREETFVTRYSALLLVDQPIPPSLPAVPPRNFPNVHLKGDAAHVERLCLVAPQHRSSTTND